MFETRNIVDEKSDTVGQKTTIFPLQNMILSFYPTDENKFFQRRILCLKSIIAAVPAKFVLE
jgi:hypothetical protein